MPHHVAVLATCRWESAPPSCRPVVQEWGVLRVDIELIAATWPVVSLEVKCMLVTWMKPQLGGPVELSSIWNLESRALPERNAAATTDSIVVKNRTFVKYIGIMCVF